MRFHNFFLVEKKHNSIRIPTIKYIVFLPHCNGDKSRMISGRVLSSKSCQIIRYQKILCTLGQTSETLFVSKTSCSWLLYQLNCIVDFFFTDFKSKNLRQNKRVLQILNLALSRRKNWLKVSRFCFDLPMWFKLGSSISYFSLLHLDAESTYSVLSDGAKFCISFLLLLSGSKKFW